MSESADKILLELAMSDLRRDARRGVRFLRSAIEKVIPYEERKMLSNRGTNTPFGGCLSPHAAASLIYNDADASRIQKFTLGFFDAVKKALAESKKRPIHALYIGSGPYATLALPVAASFPKEDLVVTAVDIHQESLECLDRVVRHFNLETSISRGVCADACTVDWSAHFSGEPDLVLMECMDAALLQEPQVQIVKNLRGQVGSSFLLVPEMVGVGVSFSSGKHYGRPLVFYVLTREGLTSVGKYDETQGVVIRTIKKPEGFHGDWIPHLETVVNTFGNLNLSGADSAITRTITLPKLPADANRAEIRLKLGGRREEVQVCLL